jgi:hypothetical protein
MLLREQGYACISDPESGIKEASTFTCNHCQRIVHVKAKADPYDLGGLCRLCDKMICPTCVGKDCVPFMKSVEQMEERYHRRRALG